MAESSIMIRRDGMGEEGGCVFVCVDDRECESERERWLRESRWK